MTIPICCTSDSRSLRNPKKTNYKDLQLEIGQVCHCDDFLQIKVAGIYPYYNSLTVAARRGESKFFLSSRGPKTDISEAVPLQGRWIVIGDDCCLSDKLLECCIPKNQADTWINTPDKLYIARLLIAGAIRILISFDNLGDPITRTPEFIQAKKDCRVTIL